MNHKIYAYVGNWSFEARPAKGKGISIFDYDPESGVLTLRWTLMPEVAAGQLLLDSARGMLYVVNECGERRGEIGGGGYVLSFRIDPETGELSFVNERDSLLAEPSYLAMDASKRYLLTCNCADPFHVTKIVKREDGSFTNQVLMDDAALVMFELEEDGGIGAVRDVYLTEGGYGKNGDWQVNVDPVTGHIQLVEVISRLHAVVSSPSGELFIACDKGMDRIYSFAVENGKLVKKDEFRAEYRTFPRYAAFHPSLPIVYCNNEFAPTLNVLRYSEPDGKLERLKYMDLTFRDHGLVDGKPVGAQDILVSPDGKTLYVSLVGINEIAVLSLDEAGLPTLVQSVPCGGVLPRGLRLSPDGRYLFSGNMVSGDISVLPVESDGRLGPVKHVCPAVSPSAIQFYSE